MTFKSPDHDREGATHAGANETNGAAGRHAESNKTTRPAPAPTDLSGLELLRAMVLDELMTLAFSRPEDSVERDASGVRPKDFAKLSPAKRRAISSITIRTVTTTRSVGEGLIEQSSHSELVSVGLHPSRGARRTLERISGLKLAADDPEAAARALGQAPRGGGGQRGAGSQRETLVHANRRALMGEPPPAKPVDPTTESHTPSGLLVPRGPGA